MLRVTNRSLRRQVRAKDYLLMDEKSAMVTGAWLETHDPGEREFIKIGYLLLENGETLPDVTIAYQT